MPLQGQKLSRMERAMFAPWRPDPEATAPLDAYQRYTAYRMQYKGGDRHDVERVRMLMWYIEHYSPVRRPLKAPLSGAQVRWLLDSNGTAMEARPYARVVEWFLQRSDLAGPFATPEGFLRVAYWWSLEKAPQLNVEHALVPSAFVAVLSAPVWGSGGEIPVNEFLSRRLEAEGRAATPLHTEALRLGAYIHVLEAPDGVHASLFFPESVVARLSRFTDVAAALGGGGGERVRALAAEAQAYRRRHARLRSGREDVSAGRLGQDFMTTGWSRPGGGAPAKAPRPTARSPLPFKVRVIGPLNSRSGLGQATRLSVQSLRGAGVEVETLDFYMDNPAPRAFYHPNDVADAAAPALNLIHLNAESIPLAAAYLPPQLTAGSYNVGYFFWEVPRPAVCHELALQQLDEVWVSSRFNQEVYAPWTAAPVSCVGMAVAQGPDPSSFDRAAVRARWDLPPSATVFVTTFDSYSFMSRKNPAGTLRAFLRAFPRGDEDVALVVKTHNLLANLGEFNVEVYRAEVLALCASDPRIHLINETLPHDGLMELKSACDVYVSLHRSEGWGFGMLEAMQVGLPVIATDFSGNTDFCLPDSAWLIPWTQRFMAGDDYIFVRPGDWWAEPDLDAAAAAMREAVARPEARRERGVRARSRIAADFSPAAIGARYLDRLLTVAAARWTGAGWREDEAEAA